LNFPTSVPPPRPIEVAGLSTDGAATLKKWHSGDEKERVASTDIRENSGVPKD
jgi:hypothetical protein